MKIYSRDNPLICALLTYQPANLLNFPSSVEITDAWNNGGSGVGIGSKALRSAVGEFYERQHFYTDVAPDLTGSLNHSLKAIESEKFIQAFTQTRQEDAIQLNLGSHEYKLSTVFRTSDLSSCHIPTACIALSTVRTETENTIYPLRDTCGCAFGWHPEQAIEGSIKELLERQFLARFWLTSTCNKIIDAPTISSTLAVTNVEALSRALKMSGELSFIDISDSEYPGVCILAVYGQKRPEHNVRYCAGMAYAATLEHAMEKSLLELWQTYRFIDLFIATEQKIGDIHDPYLEHFLRCNVFETYNEVISVRLRTPTPSLSCELPFNLTSLLTALAEHKVLGYIYLKAIPAGENQGYCSKFVSPDFFMHMDNSRNINLINRYSQTFLHEIQEKRKIKMVPFP